MEKAEKKVIGLGIIAGILMIGSLGFGHFYITKVGGAALNENRRIQIELADSSQVKCMEPTIDFRKNETAYLQKYNLLFHPTNKYDILSTEVSPATAEQFAEATQLKIAEAIAKDGCNEAQADAKAVVETDKWTYFKAHWKTMIFGE